MEDYYIVEPWDSTSTMRYPGKSMPTEEEGLQMAARGTLNMFNPYYTAKGFVDLGEGVGNDIASTFGVERAPEDPSFVGGLKDLGSSFAEDPLSAAADIVMAPGSIPGMFTGRLIPPAVKQIPKTKIGDSVVVGANKLIGREPYYHGMRGQWDGYQPSLHGLREQRPVMNMEVETPGGAPGLPSYFRSYGNEFNTRGLFTTRDLPLARHYAGSAEKWVSNAKGGSDLVPTKTGSVIRTFENPKNFQKFDSPRAMTPHAQQLAMQDLTRQQYKQTMGNKKGVRYDDFEGAGTYPTGKQYSGPTRKNTQITHPYAETTIMTKGLKNKNWFEVDPVTGIPK